MSRVFIGTSGFSYPHWRDMFYPQDLPQSKWFEYYCQHFDTVELNVSFYRLPKKETFEKWRKEAGKDFVFAVKGNRYLTHVKKLKDCREAVERFFEAAEGLRNVGGKREARNESGRGDGLPARFAARRAGEAGRWGKKVVRHSSPLLTSRPTSHFSSSSPNVVLWQLPPKFKANIERLGEFLKLLPRQWRNAFEFRDESWNDRRVFRVLRDFGAAVVFQDFPDWPIASDATADFVYLRFHGRQTLYSSCYTEKDLERWAERIRGWTERGLDVYTYFNNDALGYAVENAKTLKRLVTNT